MFTVYWKYKVASSLQAEFEKEYGSEGAWSKLFSGSVEYIGSKLSRDTATPNIYLLADQWTSEKAYNEFLTEYKSTYEALSKKFEVLYESEERMGTFIEC